MNALSPHRLLTTLLLALLALPVGALPAQSQNELVAAPDAVKLRRVWTREGERLRADEYGYNLWGQGVDLTGDSIADFGVFRNSDNTWLFYAGGDPPDTIPFWSKDSVGSVPPAVSNYWGDSRRYILFRDGYEEIVDDFSYFYDRLRLYAVGSGGVSEEIALEIDHGKKNPPVERFLRDVILTDVNNDGIDDVALLMHGYRVGQTSSVTDPVWQTWIYFGGASFTLDVPDVIVRDTGRGQEAGNNWYVRFADFDGDGRMDMVMGGEYPGVGQMLRFYWGDESSPASWAERPPDRDIVLVEGETPIRQLPRLLWCNLDRDTIPDFVGDLLFGDSAGVYVFLSTSGKNNRTRAFSVADADLHIKVPPYYSYGYPVGSLNDSTGHYDMLPIGNSFSEESQDLLLISGSANGPDVDYEARFRPYDEGLRAGYVFGRGPGRIGDVTGDGYEDAARANHDYGPFVSTGIALILAGGPYIPFDDPTVDVREVPVAGEAGGLYVWPNPVETELHLAWRGNLRTKPARFVVYDAAGREIVAGDVDPHRGEALWRCASVAAGTYVLVAYDATGTRMATTTIIKR